MNGAQDVGAARAASAAKGAARADAIAHRLARGIRAIKATQRALGLDDDTYRALLSFAPVRERALAWHELWRVLVFAGRWVEEELP